MEEARTGTHVPGQVQAEQTHLQIPSRPDWIAPAAEYLQQKAVLCGVCLEAEGAKLLMAFIEALSNAIVHGNLELSSELKERGDSVFIETLAARAGDPHFAGRLVDVLIHYDGERCEWTLTDQGCGFDVAQVLKRHEDPEESILSSGRGILMMRAFLDDVRYAEGGRQVHLTLRRKVSGEQRGDSRHNFQHPVRVAPVRADGTVDWDAAYEAVSRNLSNSGMAILQAQLAATGRVLLCLTHEGETLYVPAEVRHCRPLGDNEVELGCRFQTTAPTVPPIENSSDLEAALVVLCERLGRLPKDVTDERRIYQRLAYTERVEVLAEPGVSAVRGVARDLSRGGLAFIATAPLALVTRRLALPQGDGPPLCVRAQVVRCNRILEGFYDVGARFLGLA